jgi:anti-sigma regulatory factor (Ser/Thr protein kinase)
LPPISAWIERCALLGVDVRTFGKKRSVFEGDSQSSVFSTTEDAPRQARDFVRATLASWERRHPETAVLATSEAVTQVVITADSARVTVAVERGHDGRVKVRIHDDDPSTEALTMHRRALSFRLIDELACEWGVDQVEDDGKVLWMWLPS